MPIPDKPLGLKPITVRLAIDAMRAHGMEKDAVEMENMIGYVAEMTTWTLDDWLGVEMNDLPRLMGEFAALTKTIKETAIPPQRDDSSTSGEPATAD